MRTKLLLAALFFIKPIMANTPADDLFKALNKIQTFQADFTQKIRDTNGEAVGNTKGEVIIQRPGKFYWKSHAPDPVLVVGDGTFLWTYDIDLSQVTKQEMKDHMKNSPAALLAGNLKDIQQQFKVSKAKPQSCRKDTDQCYQLHPNQKDASFSDIIIAFAKDKITEVKMHDNLGQEVNTLFSKVQINHAVDKKIFAFTPPKGVDVIHSGK